MASPGVGTSIHLSGELFKLMTGIDMVHVPQVGARHLRSRICLADKCRSCSEPSLINRVHQDREAAAASRTVAKRSQALPEVPTVGEFVPGYEVSTGTARARQCARLPRSSTKSTRRLTQALPIPS